MIGVLDTAAANWIPYTDEPLLTTPMALGPAAVPGFELERLKSFLTQLIAARSAPVHVNVAFNAVYFGFDIGAGGYVGGPLELDDFPAVVFGQESYPLPVGAMVNITTGSGPLFAEVVYREGAHSAVESDGTTPAWLSGAPAGAEGPARAPSSASEVVRSERLVVDVDAFGQGLSTTSARLERLRQRGKCLDGLGHLILDARYESAAIAELNEAEQYQRHLLTQGRELLLSAAAPLPLAAVLTPGADEADLEAALSGMFATVAAALSQLDSARLWGAYAYPRADLARRLRDKGTLGGDDLGSLASQLARSAVPSHRGRWSPVTTVTYTAVGPLLRGIADSRRQLAGVGYAAVVAHTNTVIGDFARREPDTETGLFPGQVHLRLDDAWQAGGIWRAERPGRLFGDCDVTDPLGLGWAESTGSAAGRDLAQDARTAADEIPSEDDSEAALLRVTDSQVTWAQTLRLRHLVESCLPIPSDVSVLWDGTIQGGAELRLSLRHDGYELDPAEASQAAHAWDDSGRWAVNGIDWPLEFFPGLILTCTWPRGGRAIRVTTTLLDAPVTVDGDLIEHRYNARVLTREGDRRSRRVDPTWQQRVLTVVRRAGRLTVDGTATLEAARMPLLVCDGAATPEAVDQVDAAIRDLVLEGKLRRASGCWDESGQLVVPCLPGRNPVVPVLVYTPAVVVGVPRRPAVPAVLRGLVDAAGVDREHLRSFEVVGHLRRLRPGQLASADSREAYREYRQGFGLSGPEQLPAGYTFVRSHQRER